MGLEEGEGRGFQRPLEFINVVMGSLTWVEFFECLPRFIPIFVLLDLGGSNFSKFDKLFLS